MVLDRAQQYLQVGDRIYSPATIGDWVRCDTLPCEEVALVHWLADWWSIEETIQVQTSGSTGEPKKLMVEKARMLHSAQMTIEFLGLNPSDTALLCMDLKYIGAMMLVVRAIISGMKLVVRAPSSNPLIDLNESVSFAPFVPLQIHEILQHPESREQLACIRCVIIGGGAISPSLEHTLAEMPNDIYSTYGMTETLSHIALRRLNGSKASLYYTPLPHVQVDLSQEYTLRIHAPLICPNILETNDIAQIEPNGQFIIIGRCDNMINSGGIKIPLEQLEATISELITKPFALTWREDERLGQALVLAVEDIDECHLSNIRLILKQNLAPYHTPRQIISLPHLPRLPNGKLDRITLRTLIE